MMNTVSIFRNTLAPLRAAVVAGVAQAPPPPNPQAPKRKAVLSNVTYVQPANLPKEISDYEKVGDHETSYLPAGTNVDTITRSTTVLKQFITKDGYTVVAFIGQYGDNRVHILTYKSNDGTLPPDEIIHERFIKIADLETYARDKNIWLRIPGQKFFNPSAVHIYFEQNPDQVINLSKDADDKGAKGRLDFQKFFENLVTDKNGKLDLSTVDEFTNTTYRNNDLDGDGNGDDGIKGLKQAVEEKI